MRKRNICILDTSWLLVMDDLQENIVISIVSPWEEHPECLWHHDNCYMFECDEMAKWDSSKLPFTDKDCRIIEELLSGNELDMVVIHCKDCGPRGQGIALALLEHIWWESMWRELFSLHMNGKRTHRAKVTIGSRSSVEKNPDRDIYSTLSKWFSRDSAL